LLAGFNTIYSTSAGGAHFWTILWYHNVVWSFISQIIAFEASCVLSPWDQMRAYQSVECLHTSDGTELYSDQHDWVDKFPWN